ncbi:hypothetical protein PENSPDRAFT_684301 [Peniophora sp. CONT]|nr:hypothetical protein PENSPDRAFT_684301 [Peniophora sp. CONT]
MSSDGDALPQGDARSPVHRMNEDTLTAIFYEAVRGLALTRQALVQLRRLTQVCRAWRQLALDLTELWSDVVCACYKPALFDLVLSRARNTPLSSPHPTWHSEWRMSWILAHLERFRSLDIFSAEDWMTALAGKCCPVLTRAQLKGTGDVANITDGAWEAPALQELRLRDLRVGIRIVAPRLRFLKVAYREAPVHRRGIEDMLTGFPQLQELVLVNALTTSETVGTTGQEIGGIPIELPSLVRLELTSNVLAISRFLMRITPLNSKIGLHLILDSVHRDSDHATRLLAMVLSLHLRNSGYDSMELNVPLDYFRLFDSMSTCQNTTRDSSIRYPEITVQASAGVPVLMGLLEQISGAKLRQIHLRATSYRNNPPATVTEAELSVYRMPQLADDVDTVLYSIPITQPETPITLPPFFLDGPTVYPRLKNLVIQQFEQGYTRLPLQREFVGRLKFWLEARIEAGLPLHEVRLRGHARWRTKADSAAWDTIRTIVNFVDERQ